MKKVFFIVSLLVTVCVFLAGCYEPSPLYGKWTDNYGNSVTFVSDGTFVATIYSDAENSNVYQGDYSIIDNVLVFSVTDGNTINTEWDIRGAMLYLTWTITSDEVPITKKLTLYHVSK